MIYLVFVIVSVLFLIGLFLSISCYLIMLGINFIGLSYLLVYVGAVEGETPKYNHAALVKIQLHKVLLIIVNFYNVECKNIILSVFNKYIYTADSISVNYFAIISHYFSPQEGSGTKLKSFYSTPSNPEDKTPCSVSPYWASTDVLGYTEEDGYTKTNQQDEVFINWFVGFSDGESNFTIILHKDSNGIIKNVAFRFLIELHVDDIDALNYIKSKLNLGNDISVYGSSCKFTVTHPKDIYKLIFIFDKYNLNTTKYLDYLDFKKAFILYQEERCLSSGSGFKYKKTLIHKLLELKGGMNSKRTNFNFPTDHKIIISGPWLLGLIEGEGSFCLDRTGFRTVFSMVLSEVQLPVFEKIKEYLENNLGFDKYSMFKLKSSSVIAIKTGKARSNSKPLVGITVKNTNVLVNYFIPYLDKLTFITKKSKDFNDFKIISTAIYNGTYREDEIKSFILKLSYTMNNYRLSTNLEPEKVSSGLSIEEIDRILKARPTIIHLDDGRQLDIVTNKEVNNSWTNCVYEIIDKTGEILLASTLKEAAEILSVDFRTVKRHLDSKALYTEGCYADISEKKVRRVPVFYP